MTYTQPDLNLGKALDTWARSPWDSLCAFIELALFFFRARAKAWWNVPPFLPVASYDYVCWRLETAYGKRTPSFTQVLYDSFYFGSWLRHYRRYTKLRSVPSDWENLQGYLNSARGLEEPRSG